MGYVDALTRVNEIRERLGMDAANVRTVGTGNFDEVLAYARNRFVQGPARIVSYAENIPDG